MATVTIETPVNIRKGDKDKIIASLHPEHIIQVCGPPMVGKSTLVEQAIDGSDSQLCLRSHKFICEKKFTYQDVLNLMSEVLGLQPVSMPSVNEKLIMFLLASTLGKSPKSHHILVFHKCEGLQCNTVKADSNDDLFIDFLCRMIHLLSGTFKLSVVLTSCKKFSLIGKNTGSVEIGVLNFWDVTTILQHYAPSVNVISYASVCVNTMPFPGAVRLFAEEFLSDPQRKQPPEVLEENLGKDENFLSIVFGRKVDMVERWIPQEILTSIVHFCHSLGSSFSADHLECVITGQKLKRFKWTRLISCLQRNHIVWSLPGTNRLVVHPLLVYYWMQYRQHNRMVLQGKWYDHSSIRYTDFLCRLLHNTEMNIETHGEKDLMYGCLVQEWPHIQHMIKMTLSCNENTCKTFLKTAISARGIMLKCFNEEAHVMYQALYDTPETFFTPSERGMIEALLGHCRAATVVLAKGGTWKQAEDCLDSAIIKLRKHGPPFALMWAIYRKGIILFRQGKFKEAQMCFKAARRVTVTETDDSDVEKIFGVSKLQVKEEKITRDIYEATALIFLGQNDLAQEILLDCQQDIQNWCADHQELATLLNSLGLIEERGHGDKAEAVKFYQQSFAERSKRIKFGRDLLLVPLNNIGMIFLRLGKFDECKKYLKKALNIRRDLGWVHGHTSLTLTHMGVLNMKCGDFTEAFMNTQEADRILQQILSIHDTRLRINNTLGHLSQLFKIEAQSEADQKCGDVRPEKTAVEYFEYALEIASRITGNFSDDGYHHMLIAHEHAMLLALENSEEEYNKHKTTILPYFQVSQGVGKKVFISNEKIPNHMDLYSYFSTTNYEDIDKQVFVGHLGKACEFCQMISPFCSAEKMWCGGVQNTVDNGEVTATDNTAFDPMSLQIGSEKEEMTETQQVSDQMLAQTTSENKDATPPQLHVFVPLPSQTVSERGDDDLDSSDSQAQIVHTDLFANVCDQDQKILPSPPGNSLSLLLLKSQENQQDNAIQSSSAGKKQQLQWNKEEEPSCKVAALNFLPTNDNRAQSLPEDKYKKMLIKAHLKTDVSDSTKFTKSHGDSDYTPTHVEDTRSKAYDDHRSQQQLTSEKKNILQDNSEDIAGSTVHFTSDNMTDNHSLLDNRHYHNANTLNSNLITTENGSIRDYVDNNNDIDGEYFEDKVNSEKEGHSDQYDFGDTNQYSHQSTNRVSQKHVDNFLDKMFSHSLSLKENHEVENELSFESTLLLNNQVTQLDPRDQINQNYQQGLTVPSFYQNSPNHSRVDLMLDNKHFNS